MYEPFGARLQTRRRAAGTRLGIPRGSVCGCCGELFSHSRTQLGRLYYTVALAMF